MRVRYFPAARYDACAQYRMVLPAAVLAAQGLDVAEGDRADLIAHRSREDPERIIGAEPLDADVAVFQRMGMPDTVALFPYWQEQGTAIVVDADDLYCDIARNNQAWRYFNGEDRSHWRVFDEACRLADAVTVTTPALLRRYGAHGRGHILPNCIPERYLAVGRGEAGTSAGSHAPAGSESPDPRPVLGWAGNLDNHPGDLEVIKRGDVARALIHSGARFRAIGDQRILRRLGVEGELKPWAPFEDYPAALAELDVGMVPLAESSFNHAKSWLKGLEMAAVGVPFAATPTPEYRRLAQAGAGVLVEKPRQWEPLLRRLLSDGGWREELAYKGRRTAWQWTYEKRAEMWLESWESALRHRRGRVAA